MNVRTIEVSPEEPKRRRQRRVSKNELKKQWVANFAKLSFAEQNELLAQEEELNKLSFLHDDVLESVRTQRVAGKTMCWPDSAYVETKAFLEKYPLVHSWTTFANAAQMITDDRWDDFNFKLYGKRTRLWFLFYFEFLNAAKIWCDNNLAECEAEIREEIAAIVEAHKPDWQKELDRKSITVRTPIEDESFRKDINIGFEVQERELESRREKAWLADIDNAARMGL